MKTDNVVSMAAFQEVADELEMRQGLAELEATVARAEPRPIDAARFWRTVVAALLENHVYSAQVLPLLDAMASGRFVDDDEKPVEPDQALPFLRELLSDFDGYGRG